MLFFVAGHDDLAAYLPEGSLYTSEEILNHLSLQIACPHHVLHHPVFQRVIGDDRQASSSLKQVAGGAEHLPQGIHLVVHLDAQRLEHLRHLLLLPFTLEVFLHGLHQVAGGFDTLDASGLDDGGSHPAGALQLTVDIEDVRQLLLAVVVEDVGSGYSRAFVHPHIQRRIETEGEPTGFIVEMMTRHAEICQQSVNLFHTIIAHPVAEVAEVAPDEGEALVVNHVLLGILILVKTVKVALFVEVPEYLTAMPSTAEGDIHINAAGLDIKPADALLKEYWNVICLGCCDHRAVSAFMMSSNSRLKSSSVRSVFVKSCGDQSSMVSSIPMNWMS